MTTQALELKRIEATDPKRAVTILALDGQFAFEQLKWNEPLIEGCVVFDEGGWATVGRSGLYGSAEAAELAARSAIGWPAAN